MPSNTPSRYRKPAPPPKPIPFVPPKIGIPEIPVKVANPDVILFDKNLIEIDAMIDLVFENIAGQEIINIARNDLVNGQTVKYKPIKNIDNLALQYNSLTLAPLQKTLFSYFNNFSINLLDRIPEIGKGTGPNGEIIYLDNDTDSIVINFVNIEQDEEIEVEVIEYEVFFNDTIYGGA